MNNKKLDIIDHLYERKLIAQITNEEELRLILKFQPITLYCGFDPTADSLHVGHLAPLLCLRQFQLWGHRPLVLLGGATGLIGDPSFKDSERKLNALNIVQRWIKKIKSQIFRFFNYIDNSTTNLCIVDNYAWFSSMNVLTFLRDTGKFFSVNKMINRDIIKKRLQQNNCGISYTEFSYNLMQSYDFAYLYKNYDVILQIGGSDQWGNIISGIDLIRKKYKKSVYGLTVPLITNKHNTKFGKTEKQTIWLDSDKTSPYKFYQYWINSDDKKVYYFLQFFTDIQIKTINLFKHINNINFDLPKAQVVLAEELTRLVHGQKALEAARRITQTLFSRKILQLTATDFEQLIKDGIPFIILKSDITLQQALVESKLATSRANARELITSQAIYINSNNQLKTDYVFKNHDRLHNLYTLLRRGKKHYCLIMWKNNNIHQQ